jgi:hypothetical protein
MYYFDFIISALFLFSVLYIFGYVLYLSGEILIYLFYKKENKIIKRNIFNIFDVNKHI